MTNDLKKCPGMNSTPFLILIKLPLFAVIDLYYMYNALHALTYVATLIIIIFILFVVDGGWSRWTLWHGCISVCGGEQRHRSRTCTDPSPNLHGRPCYGPSKQEKQCPIHCVDGWF